MIRSVAAAVLALALAACSNEREGESAEDFAARVGSGTASGTPGPVETTAAASPLPADVDALALEQLGNIAGVDLGPRDGGCTFSSDGLEVLLAGGRNDPGTAGRGVVRVGGRLYLLSSAGGLDAIRKGTRFSGEGVTVDVTGSGQSATLTVRDAQGRSKALRGAWICA